jgi:hypothetical protein
MRLAFFFSGNSSSSGDHTRSLSINFLSSSLAIKHFFFSSGDHAP